MSTSHTVEFPENPTGKFLNDSGAWDSPSASGLPTQTGQSGKFLTTDGTDPSWGTPASGSIPSGVILMWSGSVATVPEGWLLCDGTNGTPDLRGKFIIGAGGAYNPADSGGEATHALTSDEMPAHTHVQDAHNHTQDAHTHVQDAHTHSFLPRSATTGSVSSIVTGTLDTSSTISGSNQPHIQSATATNQNATATNQPTTATNQNTGGGVAHNNLPPYYAMCFIQKS